MSTFGSRHTDDLLAAVLPPAKSNDSASAPASPRKQRLQALLVSLNPPLAVPASAVRDVLADLHDLQRVSGSGFLQTTGGDGPGTADDDEAALAGSVLARAAVALYADALDATLAQASAADDEAEWWAELARSPWDTLAFLVQTLPLRVRDVVLAIVAALRAQNRPVVPSAFTLASLRALFPAQSALEPGPLLAAAFPHLRAHPHAFALASHPAGARTSALTRVRTRAGAWLTLVRRAAGAPLAFTAQEAALKRDALRAVRDARARSLGRLLAQQGTLAAAARGAAAGDAVAWTALHAAVAELAAAVAVNAKPQTAPDADLLGALSTLESGALPAQRAAHAAHLRANALMRPGWLVRAWPRMLLAPPLALYAVRAAYGSRQSLAELSAAALETADRFWRDWLLEPIRGVLSTVRAGPEHSVLVNARGVAADIESLERMSLALLEDAQGAAGPELDALRAQIRAGDLTPVLRVYEADIRAPLRSALGGTLLRSVFVQVQKAKVDIDQALTGIDRLIKSQELTFAFVGVAPAIAIVYGLAGVLRRLLVGGSRRGRYGGPRRRAAAWAAMRRIERLLIESESASGGAGDSALPPLTAGLLVLSVAHVRGYAGVHLPARSRLREGLLEDAGALEDPALGRAQKLRVVDRIWRAWAPALGWADVAEGQ